MAFHLSKGCSLASSKGFTSGRGPPAKGLQAGPHFAAILSSRYSLAGLQQGGLLHLLRAISAKEILGIKGTAMDSHGEPDVGEL